MLVAALIGVVAAWDFVAGAPGVGHFRSADGRQVYLDAYSDALGTLPEPTAVHDIPTGHGAVRVYEWSTGRAREETPVLLAPGRSSGVPMWSENLPALIAERRVLAFDALGDAGLSAQTVPFSSFGDLAGPVDDVVRALAPDGVHVVGHSFGGATAAAYALRFPERVVTLTLLEPVFTLARPSAGMLAWAMVGSLPFLPAGLRAKALGKIGGVEEDPTTFRDDPTARMIAAASEHYTTALPQPATLTDDELAQLTMPVYVAIASDDSLAGGVDAAKRAAQLPRGTVLTWPDTTHSLPMQAAGELEPELLEFFETGEG